MKIFGRKKSTLSPSELYDKGYTLFVVEGDIPTAIKYFDEAILADPAFAAAYVAKGQALVNIGRIQEALSSYDKALKLAPNDVHILLQKAQVLADQDRMDESAECYDKALQLEPGNVQILSKRAEYFESIGKHDEAQRMYNKAFVADQDFFLRKALFYVEHGSTEDQEKAIYWLDRFIEKNPESVIAHLNKALSVGIMGNREEEIKLLNKALAIGENNKSLFKNNRSTLTLDQNQVRSVNSGELSLKQLIKTRPFDFQIYHYKGLALTSLCRYDEAIACFDSALLIDPNNSIACCERGFTLEQMGNYEEAMKAYNETLDIDSKYTIALNNKGVLFSRLGNHNEALKWYDKAL